MSNCKKCDYEYTYEENGLIICPICFHEESVDVQSEDDSAIRDANGNILESGDNVTIVKDLKVKGSSSSLKVGTKVKNIRLVPDNSDGHNIDCKIDGFGAMKLKSEFVKKVK